VKHPYQAEVHVAINPAWVVVGPGVGGLQGTSPRHSRDMTPEQARDLAELLNVAYAMGVSDTKRAMRAVLGIDG
jgi:hypothetical protein